MKNLLKSLHINRILIAFLLLSSCNVKLFAGIVTIVTAPTNGSNVCIGSTYNITWLSVGIDSVKIELSTDGGSSFPELIVASTPATSGQYSWNVASSLPAGTNNVIKISDAV